MAVEVGEGVSVGTAIAIGVVGTTVGGKLVAVGGRTVAVATDGGNGVESSPTAVGAAVGAMLQALSQTAANNKNRVRRFMGYPVRTVAALWQVGRQLAIGQGLSGGWPFLRRRNDSATAHKKSRSLRLLQTDNSE